MYKTKDPAKLALLEWVCAHYGFPLPRIWLTKELVRIKYPEDFEAAAMAAAAAAVAPRRELGAGLELSVALAARMAPYDASWVRPAREMPESPPRIARRESLGVGGASTTAAGNGGEASDSPPRQRRRREPEDEARSAEKSAIITALGTRVSDLEAVLAELRVKLALPEQ